MRAQVENGCVTRPFPSPAPSILSAPGGVGFRAAGLNVQNFHRYELPQPGAAQKNDIGAWQESMDNSMAQLEHQANR